MSACASLTRLVAVLLLAGALSACAAAVKKVEPDMAMPESTFRAPVSRALTMEQYRAAKDRTFVDVPDPWEGFNRTMYDFNARFDEVVFLPLVNTYEFLLPDPAQEGVHNAIANLNEVPVFLNSVLQGEGLDAWVTFWRFVFNSTLGVAGVWDPAARMGMQARHEDFGQTLGVWGVGPGPYLVLPIYGPSGVRDGVGLLADSTISYFEMDLIFQALDFEDRDTAHWIDTGVRSVDARASNPFRYHSMDTPFEYDLVRFLYTKKREIEVGR